VCFWWEDPVPLPPPTEPGENVTEECNEYGLTPGVCPSGFTCGRVVNTPYYGAMPVCEPINPGSITTTFNFPVSTTEDARNVTLRLTMNGGTWPVPASGKNAGELFIARDDGEWSRSVPLPINTSGIVNLELAPGLYRVDFNTYGTDVDKTQYPEGYRAARLRVVDDGEATANLKRHQLHWSLAIDDVVETLANQSARVTLRGTYTQAYINLARGDSMSGTFALFPDTYSVTSSFYGSGVIPNGTADVEQMPMLDPGQSDVTWRLFTVEATGTVLVDGQGFTGNPTHVDIEFTGDDGASADTEVLAGTPGRFAVRLLPGTYDVSLYVGLSAEPQLPKAGVLLRADYRMGSGPIHADLHSQTVSGSVTLNGEQLTDVGFGSVIIRSRSGRNANLSLARTGPATFAGSVFREGVYEVSTSGNGQTLPRTTPPLLPSYRPSATPLALNVDAHLVSIPVTLEGSPLSDAPTESSRGVVLLTSEGSSPTASLSHSVPATGAASVELLVPEGSWEIAYSNYSSTYDDVPYGTFEGRTISISGPGTYPLDLRRVELTVHLTQGGMQPPDAEGGKSRGNLLLFSRSLALPGSGPATVSVSLFPEIGNISLYCFPSSTPECDLTWFTPRPSYLLGYGLELR
jgi:hypothetical protein